MARLINFAVRFLTMATFELCAISLGWATGQGQEKELGQVGRSRIALFAAS